MDPAGHRRRGYLYNHPNPSSRTCMHGGPAALPIGRLAGYRQDEPRIQVLAQAKTIDLLTGIRVDSMEVTDNTCA